MVDTNQFVGMKKEDAFALAKSLGLIVRVRSEDDQAFMGTCDYRTDRVNVHIVNGVVVSASIN